MGTTSRSDEATVPLSPKKSTGKTEFSNAKERYEEVDYWNDVHERERLERLREKQQQEIALAEAKNAASTHIEAGRASPPPVVHEEAPTIPEVPSFFSGKGDYIALGFACLLMCGLTAYTLYRHRREKEIRLLKGTYLSDGTEAAWITMPALFAVPQEQAGDLKSPMAGTAETPLEPFEDPALVEFFEEAPEHLAEIRGLLPELGKTTDEKRRTEILLELHELIVLMKVESDRWDLRPVWQLCSALELLVKRLAEKIKTATPSTIRTIATALDLLADLCVRGVRPDLIINPPIAVLAVDDDPLCLRAVMFALQKAEMTPDTAETGEKALLLATDKSYDVIFMDIKMPGIDGLEACTQIHKLKKNEDTPVVFVTVQSDFHTRAQSTLAGGSDLLVKPFLMFEITVKVLIFTMRKRLGLAASLRREVATRTGASQIEGMGMAVLPPPRKPMHAPGMSPADNAAFFGVNGEAEEKPKDANGEVPSLRMAPVELLQREQQRVEKEKEARKSKWSKRRKNAAEPAKAA